MLAAAFQADAQLLGGLRLNPRDFITKKSAIDSVQAGYGLLENAVMPDLYIIRQQYRLERKGKTYGKNHKPYYGETYSLGIKVSGGMYVSRSAVEPWNGDADYERTNADGKYKPEYFWTYQRHLNDSVYKPVELDFGTPYLSAVNADKSLWFHQDLQSDFGLTVDISSGEKDGFLLWVYSTTDVQDSAMTVEMRRQARRLSVETDSIPEPVTPQEAERLIGGVFIVPKYEKGGVAKMFLAGVAVKDERGKWAIHPFTDNRDGRKEKPSDPASTK